jgi:hypothetical protein
MVGLMREPEQESGRARRVARRAGKKAGKVALAAALGAFVQWVVTSLLGRLS